ncbi:hypothetical protein B566_EDAN018221 [Ephemera danica]|nr:hypothetical protein B566_EDAN018221 [Ephemera danica]
MRGTRKALLLCLLSGVLFLSWLLIAGYVEDSSNDGKAPELTQQQVLGLLREAERDMEERRSLVERVCTKHNLGLYRTSAKPPVFKHPPTPQYGVFYIDRPHKLTYCPVYKVASSTWLHQLLLLAGHTDEYLNDSRLQISKLARQVYPQPDEEIAEEAFRTTMKLLMVRHPFERLISAYRDKLENKDNRHQHGTMHFYETFGKKIVLKFRNSSVDEHGTPLRPEPTFREYVTYLIHEDVVRFDDHWIPIYLFCTPCLVRYDVIGHVETMLRDQLYAIRAAGLENLLKPRWRHLTKGKSSAGDVAKKYFSKLSKWHVQRLYEVYQLDFELFGYSPDEYAAYAIAA